MKNLITIISTLLTIGYSHAQLHGIANNSDSPNVKLKSINIGDCVWTEGFWADKFNVCSSTMVPHMGTILKGDTGHAYNNFKIAAGLKEGEAKGKLWHDGDFYKWMESAMYVYAQNKDEKINNELDEIIEVIAKAQEDNGYLSTHIQIRKIEPFSKITNHELYNSGHLLTSACIHNRITGKTNFLNIAIKHADNLYNIFQSPSEELVHFGFNPSQIMGLVELYRTTKDKRYLELSEIFINNRGKEKMKWGTDHSSVPFWFVGDAFQDRTPLREETEAVGHAVLALYLYSGAADVYAETGEKALLDALEKIRASVVDKKMYITGACGQVDHGAYGYGDMVHEAFDADYAMPNASAYCETCANIGNAMFNWRMLGLKGESKYADIMELVMLNSALSGISVDGKNYFYQNPLRAISGKTTVDENDKQAHQIHKQDHQRQAYLDCFCCPPNIVRTIAKVSGWAYSLSKNGVAVNLYGGNKLNTKMLDGSELKLSQSTQYPWKGKINITINKCKKEPFDLMLRIPEWATGSKITVNGMETVSKITPGKFTVINRKWKKGDSVSLDMPMDIKLIGGHSEIEEVRNQVAIKRGPIVYCAESTDLPKYSKILDIYLPQSSELKANYIPNLLGGVTTISGDIKLRKEKTNGMYYEVKKPEWETVKTKFIPYFSWANRGLSEMTVWLPIIWE
ncbi:hypothetical protein A8C32_02195 [Flavivirga aquatica]|uniref:Uncharacterized protein n=1 Tax=Flavivirga aquatica TaxID=1849968 RepID=A0A1E5TAA8_9FLAO|nr:beta-L-arabinofuranosidase domain-containing protein [Flavivirga aquatica]OEK08288.1 hypothetical protein A8C32_02195 [Flavivirga aquatica]